MPRVTVKLYASVREAAGTASLEADASDLAQLLRELGAKLGGGFEEVVALAEREPETVVILVNGMNMGSRDRKTVRLSEGDEVALFPPVAGG